MIRKVVGNFGQRLVVRLRSLSTVTLTAPACNLAFHLCTLF